jgi:hypothetical protein
MSTQRNILILFPPDEQWRVWRRGRHSGHAQKWGVAHNGHGEKEKKAMPRYKQITNTSFLTHHPRYPRYHSDRLLMTA